MSAIWKGFSVGAVVVVDGGLLWQAVVVVDDGLLWQAVSNKQRITIKVNFFMFFLVLFMLRIGFLRMNIPLYEGRCKTNDIKFELLLISTKSTRFRQ